MMSVVDIHVYVNIHTYVCTIYHISHTPYIHQTYQMPFVLFSASPSKRRCWTLFWMPRIRAWCHQKLVSSTVSTSTFLVLLHLNLHKSLPKWAKKIWVHSVSLSLWNLFDTFWETWRMKPWNSWISCRGSASGSDSSHLTPFTYLPRSSK